MITITTKDLPATRTKPRRISARMTGRKTLVIGWDMVASLDEAYSHQEAARQAIYAHRFDAADPTLWRGTWSVGKLPDGSGYVFVFHCCNHMFVG